MIIGRIIAWVQNNIYFEKIYLEQLNANKDIEGTKRKKILIIIFRFELFF